jgi:hypothetical protein
MSKPRLVKPATVSVEAEITPRALKFEGEAGGFFLDAKGMTVHGEPEIASWEQALDAARYLNRHAGVWEADLLEYGFSRPDWSGVVEAIVDATKWTAATVKQYRWFARSVPRSNRVDGLGIAYLGAVASVPREDQKEYLDRAKREHLSVLELKAIVRKEKPVKRILKGQASALAKAHDKVAELAHEAASLCREISQHDCQDAEKKLTKARRVLDDCEAAVKAFRKAQGK